MTMLAQIFMTPQMLLYTLAYRLLGKRYTYTLGHSCVRAVDEITPKQRIFVLLFPMITLGSLGVLLEVIWMVTFINSDFLADPITYYFQSGPIWHQLIHFVGLLCFGYGMIPILDIFVIIDLLTKNRGQSVPNKSENDQNARNKYQKTRK